MVVAVFLSYNANNGLPFVPTYNIKVELPEASGLQKSNQVRIAGTRVGDRQRDVRAGRTRAPAASPRSRNSSSKRKSNRCRPTRRAIVQSVSAIGLKYLELEKGTSSSTLKAAQTIPASQTREPVNIDELFNMFDKPTRTAIKVNTNNFGDGLARAASGLNNTIAELRPLVTNAVPVLHNLALPATGLRELFIALERGLGPGGAGRRAAGQPTTPTWTSSSRPSRASTPSLEAATEGGPASLEQATYSLPFQAPFIENCHGIHAPAAAQRRRAATVAPPSATPSRKALSTSMRPPP